MLSSERIWVASRAAIDLRQQEKKMTTYDVILCSRRFLFSSFFGRYSQPAFCWSVRTLYSDFLLISLCTYARILAVCFGWWFIRRATHMWLIFFFLVMLRNLGIDRWTQHGPGQGTGADSRGTAGHRHRPVVRLQLRLPHQPRPRPRTASLHVSGADFQSQNFLKIYCSFFLVFFAVWWLDGEPEPSGNDFFLHKKRIWLNNQIKFPNRNEWN